MIRETEREKVWWDKRKERENKREIKWDKREWREIENDET